MRVWKLQVYISGQKRVFCQLDMMECHTMIIMMIKGLGN